jgi:glyoxylase-like metal-dependent hydrolase (beta-lactamase superfamily II)
MQNPYKLFDRIYLAGGPEITDERDCCIYLIDGGKELALIDSGLGFSCKAILDNIKTRRQWGLLDCCSAG